MKLERTIVHIPSNKPDYWWADLHIISDEEILEGQYFYNTVDNYIAKATNRFVQDENHRKIIGTTDSSIQHLMQDDKGKLHLNIPSISEDITTAYAASPFNKVMVEYEDYEECHNYNGKHLNKDCSCKGGDFRRPVKLCNDRTLLSVSLVEEEKMIPISEVKDLLRKLGEDAEDIVSGVYGGGVEHWIKANVK